MAPKPGRSKKRSSMAAPLAYAARRAERRSRRDGERAKDEKLPSVGGATGSARPEEPPAALKHQVPSIGSGTECVAKLSPDTTNNFAKAIPPPAPIVSTTTAPPDLPSSKESPHTDVSGDVADLVPPTPPATEIRAEKPSPAAAPAGTSSLAAKHEHSVSTPGTQDNEKSNVGKVVVSGQTGLTSTEPQEPHSEPMPSGATFHPSQSELTQAAGTPKREVGEKEGLPVVRRSPRLQTGNQVSPWVDNLRKERPWDRAVRETRENVIVIDDANDGDDDVDDIPSSGFGSEIAVKLAQVQDGNPKFFSVCNPTTKMFTSILGKAPCRILYGPSVQTLDNILNPLCFHRNERDSATGQR